LIGRTPISRNPAHSGVEFFATPELLEQFRDQTELAKFTNNLGEHCQDRNGRGSYGAALEVVYDFGELDQVALAYAITIHKSQGSEFPAVVIPLATQQYLLLQRNLVYTGITRGKKLVVVIGQRKALAIAVRNNRTESRFSGLLHRLRQG
jgi:exodeoxyribonuclease V alpha subunit